MKKVFFVLNDYIAKDKGGLKTGWDKRHNEALENPLFFERAVVSMLTGLEMYIHDHQERYEDEVFNDGVLSRYIVDVANGIRGLLNGETGRLDCGTIDARLVEILKKCRRL